MQHMKCAAKTILRELSFLTHQEQVSRKDPFRGTKERKDSPPGTRVKKVYLVALIPKISKRSFQILRKKEILAVMSGDQAAERKAGTKVFSVIAVGN